MYTFSSSFFYIFRYCSANHRNLHSFPTRRSSDLDVVTIIRGGGGEVGLASYNNYKLARAVAEFPIPVLTGIGHATNEDRKSTRLNSSHVAISYAVFCLKKKKIVVSVEPISKIQND